MSRGWKPQVVYEEKDIGSLNHEHTRVTLSGRIVNVHHQHTPSKTENAAKGLYKVILKDDTGLLMVKLWYAKTEYRLRLGLLASIWTSHVSNTASLPWTRTGACFVTSVFPERDNTCYFEIHEDSSSSVLCRTPLGYGEDEQLANLMTLKSFSDGGYEVAGGRILVCVKSIGDKKILTGKKGQPMEKMEVNVFDATYQATLTLWSEHIASAAAWKSSNTVLLLTNASFRSVPKPTISITASTHVEVDPGLQNVRWLRMFADTLTRRNHVNPYFPKDVFDMETATTSENRILFTLGEIDEFARASPNEIYMGYLNLLMTNINITGLHRREILCCTECCGVPLYGNATIAKCKHCLKEVQLRLNPRIVSMLMDETGNLAGDKLIWSTEAWEQLLGRSAEDFLAMPWLSLKYLEQRLQFVHVTLLFGWSAEAGRLAVCKVVV